jgi:hypothetical protein
MTTERGEEHVGRREKERKRWGKANGKRILSSFSLSLSLPLPPSLSFSLY